MSWMDSWSRPSKSQATPAPYYLIPGGEDTPYCHSCGRVISSRRTGNNATTATSKDKEVKYCSSRCRSHKPGKLDREIEGVFVGFLNGAIEKPQDGSEAASNTRTKPHKSNKSGGGKRTKGDARLLISCDEVERHVFPKEDAGSASGTEDGHTDGSYTDQEPSQARPQPQQDSTPSNPVLSSTGTLEDPISDAQDVDFDRLARLSIRSGTRIRPPQDVSEVNGSVGGEKGRAERLGESEDMLEKRREGMRRVRQREMVRCAARRGVVFGFEAEDGKGSIERRKCEAVMLGQVVEPSFAKGNWSTSLNMLLDFQVSGKL
ncbi:hypothetical protein N0V93_003286 [Gnomoniopsis smithogilvyi]|uniref:Uncharacterized protein n=1 Tax=Gnomoniopsis smithogilvyi TaxID=1191159 RepID=A0A9W8YWD6_9PEZI|nr:hypothetical protein N0V93_003286 [Gnomoniopsis smithogilvyi]